MLLRTHDRNVPAAKRQTVNNTKPSLVRIIPGNKPYVTLFSAQLKIYITTSCSTLKNKEITITFYVFLQLLRGRAIIPFDGVTSHLCTTQESFFVVVFHYQCIDLFHNGGQIEYSFVLMLISLISLAAMGTIQKNISTKVRPVGLIDINTNATIYESGLCSTVFPLLLYT